MSEFVLREAGQPDMPYVLSSWISSYRDHTLSRLVRAIPSPEYHPRWNRIAQDLIARSRVLLAAAPEDESVILGWICFEESRPRRLHYLHVKRAFQRLGLARALMAAADIDLRDETPVLYSHKTTPLEACRPPQSWTFAPWMLLGARP